MNREEVQRTLDRLLAQVGELAREIQELRERLEEDERANHVSAGESPRPDGSPADVPSLAPTFDSPVEAWLKGRNITVLRARRGDNDRWDTLDPLVKQIGRSYTTTPALQSLLAAVRRYQAGRRPFTIDLSGRPAEEISRVTNIAVQLYRLGFLSRYVYLRGAKRIHAEPPRGATAINFLTGQWFERYVYLEAVAALSARNIDWDGLFNVQVRFPSGQEAELDALIMPAGWPNPIWLEAKSGDYQEHLARYADMRQALGIPLPAALLVVLGLPSAEAAGLSDVYPLTVVNEAEVRDAVGGLLDGEPLRVVHLDAGAIQTLLRRRKMRPLGEVRRRIVEAAVEVLPQADGVWPLKEVTDRLAHAAGVSKRAANEVLTALRRGGVLEAEGRVVHLSRPTPLTAEALEEACLRAYREAVEEDYPGALADDANRREFERAVQPSIALAADD